MRDDQRRRLTTAGLGALRLVRPRVAAAIGPMQQIDAAMADATGASERIGDRIPAFPFVQPIPWVQVTDKIAGSEVVVVY